ncbi:hypothetical protein BV20DRAFT_958225, partial [Pilatotrama ljubarskyi]
KGEISRWPDLLPHAQFADRITIWQSTGFSLYFLLHGVHPVLPMDLRESTFMVQGLRQGLTHSELLALHIQQLERRPKDVAQAAEVLRKTRITSKEAFEKRFAHWLKKEAFQPGDLVLVRNTAIEKEMNRKHKPRYLGPYEVVRQTCNGSYVIKELNGDISRESVAAFRLLAYNSSDRKSEEVGTDPIELVGEGASRHNQRAAEDENEPEDEVEWAESMADESEDDLNMDMLPIG